MQYLPFVKREGCISAKVISSLSRKTISFKNNPLCFKKHKPKKKCTIFKTSKKKKSSKQLPIKLQTQSGNFINSYLKSNKNITQNVQKIQPVLVPLQILQPQQSYRGIFKHLQPKQFQFGSYSVMLQKELLLSYRGQQPVQIASLTKIMTFLTIINLAEKYGFKLVSSFAAFVEGTHAKLEQGDWLPASDMLYAMMLPSGNDAATALAENFGKIIYYMNKNKHLEPSIIIKLLFFQISFFQKEIEIEPQLSKQYFFIFTKAMTSLAKDFHCQKSNFVNPSGLPNPRNISTAQDITRLTVYAMQNKLFRTIVASKKYSCIIKNKSKDSTRQTMLIRVMYWQNTNKLLWRNNGCIGVKTGLTHSAGPCLISSFLKGNNQYYITLLNYKNFSQRFDYCQKMLDYIEEQFLS